MKQAKTEFKEISIETLVPADFEVEEDTAGLLVLVD
jgi:hypothetical protein